MSADGAGGLGHWKSQRLSSVLLIPLTAWLLWVFVAVSGTDHASAAEFFRAPFNTAMALLTAAVMVHHTQNGITVVCEDYVSPPGLQSALIWLTRLGCLAGFLVTAYALFVLWQGA
jgi:succinate dehydrogenase / fumarate reductase membrane anchor subunit